MPKCLIEREVPDAAALTAADLEAISQRSCAALRQLGPSIQWVHSYVTEDTLTCVSIAPTAERIREHARIGITSSTVFLIDPRTMGRVTVPARFL
jgi:Protein of unknown function (DUF4242)